MSVMLLDCKYLIKFCKLGLCVYVFFFKINLKICVISVNNVIVFVFKGYVKFVLINNS